jgi:hypothetical protein
MYAIKDFQCELHPQYQNPAECRIQEVKKLSNQILDCTGAPPNLWLLCVLFIVYLINHFSLEALGCIVFIHDCKADVLFRTDAMDSLM